MVRDSMWGIWGGSMKCVLMIFAAATVTTAAVNGELTAAGTRSCESLASLTLPGTTITFAKAVDAGEFTPPVPVGGTAPRPAAVQAFRSLQAFCRVAAALKPARDSDLRIDVGMPLSAWNGQLRGSGRGRRVGRF